MLPEELRTALLASASRLAGEVTRLGGPAVSAEAVATFLTALAIRLYSLAVQQAPEGGVVRFVTDGEDLQVSCELNGQARGVSALALARAVMFTADGGRLSGPFEEHLLNGDDASAAVAWLSRHVPTETLLARTVWLQQRELQLMREGYAPADAALVVQQELLEREGGSWRARGEQDGGARLARTRPHRA